MEAKVRASLVRVVAHLCNRSFKTKARLEDRISPLGVVNDHRHGAILITMHSEKFKVKESS